MDTTVYRIHIGQLTKTDTQSRDTEPKQIKKAKSKYILENEGILRTEVNESFLAPGTLTHTHTHT